MKEEDLKEEGLSKEQVTKVMKLYHEKVDPVKKKLQETEDKLKNTNEKLTTTEEALKKFEGADPVALKQQIEDLKKDLEEKEKGYRLQIEERDFNELLKDSISAAKGVNAKAITALLDVETLKQSKNQKEDMVKALKVLAEAEDSKMLFKTEDDDEIVGHGDPIGIVTHGNNQNMATAAMRSLMGLPANEK